VLVPATISRVEAQPALPRAVPGSAKLPNIICMLRLNTGRDSITAVRVMPIEPGSTSVVARTALGQSGRIWRE
jgi:hypothetical protein